MQGTGELSSLLILRQINTFLGITTAAPESGVLKIYSACETGLAPGKSVKVRVNCLFSPLILSSFHPFPYTFWYPRLMLSFILCLSYAVVFSYPSRYSCISSYPL